MKQDEPTVWNISSPSMTLCTFPIFSNDQLEVASHSTSWSQADAWGHYGLIGSVSCGQAVSKPPCNECLLKRFSLRSGRPKMMAGWWFHTTTQWIRMGIFPLHVYAIARWCQNVLKHYHLSQTSDDDPNFNKI